MKNHDVYKDNLDMEIKQLRHQMEKLAAVLALRKAEKSHPQLRALIDSLELHRDNMKEAIAKITSRYNHHKNDGSCKCGKTIEKILAICSCGYLVAYLIARTLRLK